MMNKYFSLLIGLLMICSLLYNRLIKSRLPRDLFDSVSTEVAIGYMLCVIIALFCIIYLIYSLFLKNNANKSNFWGKIAHHPYNPINIIKESLNTLDIYLKNSFPMFDENYNYIYHCLKILGETCYKFSTSSIKILFLLKIIPQIIVLSLFLTDILIYHRFFYFYKTLWLLIIPLLVNYYIYSLSTFVEDNLAELNHLLSFNIIHKDDYTPMIPLEEYTTINIYDWEQIVKNDTDDTILCHQSLKKTSTENSFDKKATLDFCISAMHVFFNINTFVIRYKKYKAIIEAPWNIMKYLLYLIGWVYILQLIVRNGLWQK